MGKYHTSHTLLLFIILVKSLLIIIFVELLHICIKYHVIKYHIKTILFLSQPFLYSFIFECSIQFFTFQNLPNIVNGSHHIFTFTPFSHYFHSLSPFYTLKINRSHHFTHFCFSFPLLYTYFLTSVPKPNVKN